MEALFDTLLGLWRSLPTFAAIPITLVAGWLCALLVRFLLSRFLALVRLDRLSEKTGAAEFLKKGGVERSASSLAGTLAYWIVLLLTFFSISKMLDIGVVNSFSAVLLASVPSLLAALLIVVIGLILISFVSNFVLTVARNAGSLNATLLARIVRYVGKALVIVIALEELGLGKTIISVMIELLFGAVAFGLALAFGLGCKDMARLWMERFVRSLKEREGGGQKPDLEG
jgi:hypothetical protein